MQLSLIYTQNAIVHFDFMRTEFEWFSTHFPSRPVCNGTDTWLSYPKVMARTKRVNPSWPLALSFLRYVK